MVGLSIPSPNHGQLSGERLDALVTGAAAVPLTLKALSTDITSGGTAGNEDFTIPNGTYVGERKHIKLKVRTNGADVVRAQAGAEGLGKLTARGMIGETPVVSVTVFSFAAAGEEAMIEWNGTDWNILYSTGTVTTT